MSTHVFAHCDADGYCAAAAVHCLLDGEAIIHPSNYHWTPNFEGVKPGDRVFVVDFSFENAGIWQILFRCCGGVENVTWFDHHATASWIPGKIPDLKGRFDTELSGAEITWEALLPDGERIPDFVRLVGDWDTWRWQRDGFEKRRAQTVRRFQQGLKLYDISDMTWWRSMYLSSVRKQQFPDLVVQDVIDKGRILDDAFGQHYKTHWLSYGFNATIDGVACNVLNDRGSSLMFDCVEKRLPVQASFVHDGEKYIVSLYSASVDVSEIAKKFGGGGHIGAAGFSSVEFPFRNVQRHYQRRDAK